MPKNFYEPKRSGHLVLIEIRHRKGVQGGRTIEHRDGKITPRRDQATVKLCKTGIKFDTSSETRRTLRPDVATAGGSTEDCCIAHAVGDHRCLP